VVYSTDTSFAYQFAEILPATETLPNQKQQLKVALDKKMRKGKVVTTVSGFVGTLADLEALAKLLKQKCGVGGSAKEGLILIQGDFKQKIVDLLVKEGYKVKVVG